MADIDVTFGTNAPVAAKEIDGAATATSKAAAATVKHSQAVKVDDAALSKVVKASLAVTAATKAETVAHDANTAALHRATAAKKAHSAAGDVAQESMHEHTHAGWTQAARVGGFRHELHAAEFAQGAISGGPQGLAVGGTLLAAMAMEKLVEGIGKGIEVTEERIHADREYIEMIEKAHKEIGEYALGAVKEFGSSLIDLTARGGGLKELSEELAKDGAGGGLAASQRAVLLANQQFPGHEKEALKQANDAGSLTGEAVDKSMERLLYMPLKTILNGNEAGRAAVSMFRGKNVSQDEYEASAFRTSNDRTTMAIRTAQSFGNKGDISNVDKIQEHAVESAVKNYQQILDPVSTAIQENAKKLQEQLDDAKKTRESLTTLQTAVDNLRFSLNHINMGEKSTLTKIDEAGAKLHDNATRQLPSGTVPSSWGPLPPGHGASHP